MKFAPLTSKQPLKLMKFPDPLTRNLNSHLGNCDQKYALSLIEAFKKVVLKHGQINPKLPASYIRDLVEKYLSNPESPSCRKGCNHCCYIPNYTTKEEVSLALELFERKGGTLDLNLVEKQASYSGAYGSGFDRFLKFKERRCPFLGSDGLCGVYEKRPVTCIVHSVSSPAKNCNTQKYPDGEISLRVMPLSELIYSVWLNDGEHKQELLGKHLLDILTERTTSSEERGTP